MDQEQRCLLDTAGAQPLQDSHTQGLPHPAATLAAHSPEGPRNAAAFEQADSTHVV